jgi:uncharacterized membrane protein
MKKLTLKLIISIILVVGFSMMAHSVLGQTIENYLKGDTITELIEKVTSFALNLVTPIVVLMSLYSAFLILTAAGDPKKITQGKQALTWTVVGLTVILISHGLIQIVGDTASSSSIDSLVQTIIRYMRNIGGPIAIVMYLYGSFLYVSGNPKNAEKGMKVLLWTSVAVAIIMIATSIESIVRYFIS